MIYFQACEGSTGQILEAHYGTHNELFVQVKDSQGNCESIILDSDQVDELLTFLQLKTK